MYTLIEQSRLNAPRRLPVGPLLGASLLTSLDKAIPFRGHAIKYVLRGTERYTVNGRPFVVRAGHYLVANPHSTGHVTIDSPRAVAGLCADLPLALIDGMVSACTRPDDLERTSLHHFFNSGEFVENSLPDQRTEVGAIMRTMAAQVHADPHHAWSIAPDLYLRLAEAYVLDHRPMVPLLGRVKAARSSTRKEVLRGLVRARSIMHDDLSLRLDVEDMAREAGMSVFHFFRAFRSVYGVTPHHYRNDLRLQQAAALLSAGAMAPTDVALHCGYADVASFSKAFKKKYGVPPSAMRGGSRRI